MNRPPRPKEQGKTENYIERKCRELMEAKITKLKRKLKKCVCPNCGFGFERKENNHGTT